MSSRYIVASTLETEEKIIASLKAIGLSLAHYLGRGNFSVNLTEEQTLVIKQCSWYISLRKTGRAVIC